MMDCKKVKFNSEKTANKYIAKLKLTSDRTKIPKRAYLCVHCNCWHLTSLETFDSDESEVEKLKKEIKRLQNILIERDNEIKNKIKQIMKFQKMLCELRGSKITKN